MREASFFLPRLTRQTHDQRVRLSRNQGIESSFNFFQTGKLMKPKGARRQFARCLRSSEQQHTHQRQLRLAQMHYFRQHMFVFRHATGAAVEHVGKILLAQSLQSLRDTFVSS